MQLQFPIHFLTQIRTALALPFPPMARLILFNKPYGVITQFGPSGEKATLKSFIPLPGVYPAGRLDTDSEGLLLLTDDGVLQARISDPKNKLPKVYRIQVEGTPADAQLEPLRHGVDLGNFFTLPAQARRIDEPPGLWARNPPIRLRTAISTRWLGNHAIRREEPSGTAHDSQERLPYPAADPFCSWPLETGWTQAGRLAR